jgi:hypothetical protein
MKTPEPRVKHAMDFKDEDEKKSFYSHWNDFINNILLNENPENKSRDELSKMYWISFQAKCWDWEKHCFIPEEKAPPQEPVWRFQTGANGSKFEIYDEALNQWIETKRK